MRFRHAQCGGPAANCAYTPATGPAEPAHDRIHGLDQVREVLRVGQDTAPATGMRQRTDQQMRVAADAPRGWRIRQFEPVPLGLLARWMRDDRDVAAARDLAGFAMRAQLVHTDRRGQRRIRAGEPEPGQLVEQRRRPQVRVIGQSNPAVFEERVDQRRLRALPPSRLALAGQIRAHRLAVHAQVPGDRRDRPALLTQRMRLHVFLPRQHPPLPQRSTMTTTANPHLEGH